MKKSGLGLFLIAAIAFVGLNMEAKASTIIATVTSSTSSSITQTATIDSQTTDWSYNLSFAQFNGSLGTLNSVELIITTSLDTVLTITNNAASTSSGSAQTRLKVTFSGSPFSTKTLTSYSMEYDYSLAAGGSTTSGTLQTDPDSSTTSSDTTYTSASVLSALTGTGNLSLAIQTLVNTVLTNTGGSTAATQASTAGSTVAVVYNYTASATPEPETWLMLVGGMGLLLLGMRRKHHTL
jgi:hypothetical protein